MLGFLSVCKLTGELNPEMEFNIETLVIHPSSLPRDHIVHELLLMYKQFVYAKRCGGDKPSFAEWKYVVGLAYKIACFNVKSSKQLEKTRMRWEPVVNLFEIV